MTTQPPELVEFRYELVEDGIGHLIFDMPGRTMNVFSNRAILEAEAVADWLGSSGLKGLVVSSGKTTAFCAGADLGELAQAYAMIIAAPEDQRWQIGRDHFSPIGRAFRKLETAGVPVAFAINGLALGGGCEFALSGHYRVLADTPSTALGLPESLVGLLPGGGGTQRMPRLVGVEAAMPVLLDAARLTVADAVAAGAAHRVVPAGQEIAACVEWIRSNPQPIQPWDRADYRIPSSDEVSAQLVELRRSRQEETGGHYPAITSILDCVEYGLPLPIDAAVSKEIDIFADLIKRPEPRDMISSLFLGKQIWQKQRKTGTLPEAYDSIAAAIRQSWANVATRFEPADVEAAVRWARLSATILPGGPIQPISDEALGEHPGIAPTGIWIDAPQGQDQIIAGALLGVAVIAALENGGDLDADSCRAADFHSQSAAGFPAYLGGPFALYDSIGSDGVRRLIAPLGN
ncbi:Enoyl-CoA hydratase/carnithine racemase [Paracoccus alkenifer]|uniref:Enoyl-CoA hydratase/carnithine racemase n=2 Tax=Paracoccus alkenifer TaxID=65735 RepID=A0A1H6NMF9_9RHOB|nr:Enoyl-CoA hydratase/carnithine racemase [Paracoccus alkenifer]